MTTLDLAAKIADAMMAVYASDHIRADSYRDALTQAVLRTLYETDSWFCRLSEDADGLTKQEPYEFVQLELFR